MELKTFANAERKKKKKGETIKAYKQTNEKQNIQR